MWMSILAADKFNSGYAYVIVEKAKGKGGRASYTGTQYPRNGLDAAFPISFLPETAAIQMGDNGNTVQGMANAVSTYNWFSGLGIKPHLDDFITGPDDVKYRVVGVDDYTRYDSGKIYYFYLRRDEIDFGR